MSDPLADMDRVVMALALEVPAAVWYDVKARYDRLRAAHIDAVRGMQSISPLDTQMSDPLADVIAKARRTKPQRWIEAPSTTDKRIADGIRAHLAAVLRDEEKRWGAKRPLNTGHGFAEEAIANIRTALGVTE